MAALRKLAYEVPPAIERMGKELDRLSVLPLELGLLKSDVGNMKREVGDVREEQKTEYKIRHEEREKSRDDCSKAEHVEKTRRFMFWGTVITGTLSLISALAVAYMSIKK